MVAYSHILQYCIAVVDMIAQTAVVDIAVASVAKGICLVDDGCLEVHVLPACLDNILALPFLP